jgi:hypothetical protein
VVLLHGDVDCQIIKRGRFRQQVEPVTQAKYSTDRRIDAYIKSLPSWQQTVCQQVRDVVHAADPDVVETIKRTRLPYFTLNGNICALLAAKAHVNIFIYDPIAPDPDGIINQGQANATARSIQVREGEEIRKRSLLRLFKAVIANNRAGGWRRVGRAR